MPDPATSYLGFVEAVKICFNKYADFKGRATRAEYWWWYLFTVLVSLVLGWIPFLGWAVSVAVLIPTLAVSWRRDRKSTRLNSSHKTESRMPSSA